MTPEEKAILQIEINTVWAPLKAGADIIQREMTEPGSASVETWVTIPEAEGYVDITKRELLASMTAAERAAFRAFLATTGSVLAEDIAMFYDAASEFPANHPVTIQMFDGLQSAGIISAETTATLKRFGQRLQSRSEELIGRNVTIDEIREEFF